MSAEWFPRLGDVPGVEYRSPLAVDRTRIPGHDVQPEVHAYTNIYGEPDTVLHWGWGNSDWAPVRQHMERIFGDEGTSTERLLRRLWEALELPGEPVDYHWVLRPALERLWSRRLAEPDVLARVESLAWVDIRLVLAFPRECYVLVRPMDESGERYNRLAAFQTLIRLYVGEGFLRTALEVAELERHHFPVEGGDLADIRSAAGGGHCGDRLVVSVDALLRSDSFLEHAFLRWVLAPAATPEIARRIQPQRQVEVGGRPYRLDYEFVGGEHVIAVELDGFEFHGNRYAFSYDRMRQNDLQATGLAVVRFSYDSIRLETRRCVEQLQAVLALDAELARYVIPNPEVPAPDDMDPDPLYALRPMSTLTTSSGGNYFDGARQRLNQRTLRTCQREAFAALANYYLARQATSSVRGARSRPRRTDCCHRKRVRHPQRAPSSLDDRTSSCGHSPAV